jgi:predicted nucleic-acid-binding Zn-ribbon protein
MFKCPKCGPECDVFDEVNRTCMHNTKLVEVHDVDVEAICKTVSSWTNPAACFDEMD